MSVQIHDGDDDAGASWTRETSDNQEGLLTPHGRWQRVVKPHE